jgi:hypothetical protein
MNDEPEEKELLELGRELSEHLLRRTEERDREALFQARQRALLTTVSRERAPSRRGGWLAATAAAGVAALGIVMVAHVWDGVSPPGHPDGREAFLAKNLMEDEAPWHENLDMLQNMDFTLWLDMADPEDAG